MYLDEARGRWLGKPRWSAPAIAELVAGQHPGVRGLKTYLRKVLAAEERQACFDEDRQLRRDHPEWTLAAIVQTVMEVSPRRQKFRGIEADLAKASPPETRR